MTVVHHQAFRHRALSHGPPRTSAATVAPRMGEVEIVGIDCPLSRSARKPSRVLDDEDVYKRQTSSSPRPKEAFAMAGTVRIPTTLRTLTGGTSSVDVAGTNVGEVLASLEEAYPGFRERIFGDDGQLRRFVNVFVSDEDVRYLDGLSTPVPDGETVAIVPAVAGG